MKKFDFLSPTITFYHQGALSHSSIISGILSVFSLIVIFLMALYFSLDIIKMKNPSSFSFNTFVDDAGIFPLNASSFFHFISMSEDSANPIDKGVNFKNFRIIGFETYYPNYINDGNLSHFNHWLYGLCNNQSDTKGINYLVNQQYYQNSACIRKYFDSSTQTYYNTDDINFRWPTMAHGTYNKNKQFYSLIVQRCKEETINHILGDGEHCSNDDEMNDAITHNGVIHFNYIDNYIDVLNYKEPNRKFFYRVENALSKENYSVNHLNFNSAKISTNNGLIFDKYKYEYTYVYERNDVFTYPTEGAELYMCYYLWLNNRMYYYERIYKKIQDVISDIGGLSQFIIFVAVFINNLYNNYIILYDTEKLLYISIDSEKNNQKTKNIKENKLSITNINDSSEKGNLDNIIKGNSEQYKLNSEKSNKKLKKIENNHNNKSNNHKENNEKEKTNYIDIKKNNQVIIKRCDNFISGRNKKNSFWRFLCFKFFCQGKNSSFKIYSDFRMKIISEEHLVKNHLNIYKLLKITKKKEGHKRNSYQLKDLFNLA